MKTTGNEETMAENKTSAPAGPVEAQVVTAIKPAKLTLAQVRERLDGKTGRRFWKNLDELAETPAFQELMNEEFPRQASGVSEWIDPVSRRGFMKVMGASIALAGLAGCTKQPDEPIYPYIRQPEDLILGKPMFFATAHPFPTGAIPVLVKSNEFRPIKLEGNPEHPVSKGKSDAITQATLLDLYDPDRSQHCLRNGSNSEWSYFQNEFSDSIRKSQGAGTLFPERDDHVSDAGGAVEAGAGSVPGGQAGAVGRGEPGQLAGGVEGGVRRVCGCAVQARERGCDRVARCGLPGRHSSPWISSAGLAVCGAAAVRQRQDR